MENVIAAMTTMPTAIYTVGMLVLSAYWLFVIVGFLDIELIPLDAPELDSDINLGIDADGDVDADFGHAGIFTDIFSSLGVGTVPLTIILSLLISSGWLIGLSTEVLLWPSVEAFCPDFVFSIAQGSLMFFAGIKITALCAIPLKTKLKVVEMRGHAHLIGRTVVVTSSTVNEQVGQASLREPGLDIVLTVRTEVENSISKNDHVVVIDYIQEKNIYRVKSLHLNSEGE